MINFLAETDEEKSSYTKLRQITNCVTYLEANYVRAVFNDLLDDLESTCRPLKGLVRAAGEVVVHFTKCY
jgi:hypothetical protein